MRDADCIRFLQWALPRLGLEWRGFRRVRRQVCRRIAGRMRELGVADLDAYRGRLESDEREWRRLEALCRVTISRFYRDRRLWQMLAAGTLPGLCRRLMESGDRTLRVWSAGCGSGEEPYTVALLSRFAADGALRRLPWEIVATDLDEHLLRRAEKGLYPDSSLRELPARWRSRAFRREPAGWRLEEEVKRDVRFLRQDLRRESPGGSFHLILCRNLAFTYFDSGSQSQVLDRLIEAMAPEARLAIGSHERLPEDGRGLAASPDLPCLYALRELSAG